MIKTYKTPAAVAGLLAILVVLTGIILQKYLPLFLHQTVYYCQEIFKSISIQLPGGFNEILLTGSFFLTIIIVLKFIFTAHNAGQFRKKLNSQIIPTVGIQPLLAKLRLENQVLVIKDTQPLAFCFGISRPMIYLSSGLLGMLKKNELEAVLRHEKYHLDHKDSLVLFLVSTTAALLPFFPILIDLINFYRTKQELNADQEAIRAMSNARSLVSVLRKFLLYKPSLSVAFVPALAEWDTLNARIKSIVHKKAYGIKISLSHLIVSLLSVLVTYGLMLVPVNAVELHDKTRDIMMVCTPGRECSNWCKETVPVVQSMTIAPTKSTHYTPALISY